jgi:bifunctional non-homologous end joining protein LigD
LQVIERDWRALAASLRPMLASAGELPQDDADWAYEIKWDGLRAIAGVGDGAAALYSRTGREVTRIYPELQALASAARGQQLVLDGEIVAFGGGTWPNFEALQQRMNLPADQAGRMVAEVPVTYLAFDLLYEGEPLFDRPYRERRARLDSLGLDGSHWQTPPAFMDLPGTDALALSQRNGLEGIMAKRVASRYEPGKRSAAWRKIKNVRRQEFVVGGWKPGEGARAALIGSLLVGVQTPDGLTYAGHVGTGFTAQTLRMLSAKLAPLRRTGSPFGMTVPAEHARSAVWVEPLLVVEVRFTDWTSSGRLRAPAYLGLRADKDPAEVIREPTGLRPELVGRVLIAGQRPHLGDLALAHVKHLHALIVQLPAVPGRRDDGQRDDVSVVSDDVVQFDRQRPAAKLAGAMEPAADFVNALISTA